MSTSLAQFAADLRRLPQVVANKVAAAAAPALTEVVRGTFDAGEDAFGGTWKLRADGHRATLKKSGALASKVHYVAIGSKLRLALGVAYAKYQVGRRPITPKQGQPLPVAYTRVLERTAIAVCREELGR